MAAEQIHEHPNLDLEGRGLVGLLGTQYPEPAGVRFDLAIQTIDAYREADRPLIVVDSSSDQAVRDSLAEHGAIVVAAPRPGIATQYVDGAHFALKQGADRLLKQEPEKTGLVAFAPEIDAALDSSHIVVIGRTERGLDSLPPTQARTEKMAGWLMEKHLGFPPDALSGGRGFTRRGALYLADYDDEIHGNNWMYLYTTVLDARDDGLPVGGVQVDLIHPPEMVSEETNHPTFDTKRYHQFFLQMDYLLGLDGYQAPRPKV